MDRDFLNAAKPGCCRVLEFSSLFAIASLAAT